LILFVVVWYIFPVFGKLHQEKSGNPVVPTRLLFQKAETVFSKNCYCVFCIWSLNLFTNIILFTHHFWYIYSTYLITCRTVLGICFALLPSVMIANYVIPTSYLRTYVPMHIHTIRLGEFWPYVPGSLSYCVVHSYIHSCTFNVY
jgi:hypothetical protein